MQRFLLLQQISNIDTGTDISQKIPVLAKARHSAVRDEAIFTIMASEAIFHRKWLPCIKRCDVRLETILEVIGVDSFRPTTPEFLFHSSAGECEPGFIEEGAQLVFARHPDQNRRSIRHCLKTFLAFS